MLSGSFDINANFNLASRHNLFYDIQPVLTNQQAGSIAILIDGMIFVLNLGSAYAQAFGKPAPVRRPDPRPTNPVPTDDEDEDEDDDDGTVPSTDDDVPDAGGGTGTGATGGQRGGGTLGPVTPLILTKTLQVRGFSDGPGFQDIAFLNSTESNPGGITAGVRGVGLAAGLSVHRTTRRGEIVYILRVQDSMANGSYRFDAVTTPFDGSRAITYSTSLYINRHIVQPPRPARPNPKLAWGPHSTSQSLQVKLADRARFRVRVPRALGSQDGTIRVTGFVSGDIIYGSEQNEVTVPNGGLFPIDISSLGSGNHEFDLALKAESDTLEVTTLITVRVNIEQPDVVDPGSTNGGGRGRVRPEVLAWAGGYIDGATQRVSITRQQLPYQLPGCGVADATYSISNPADPTMILSTDRRVTTERPQLYASGRSFVYRATKDGQSISLVVFFQVAAPAAEPLVWRGYEGYNANSEVEFRVNNNDPLPMLVPTGGVAPYTISLRGVNPARTLQYRPNGNDIIYPQGLEIGDSLTATAVATDSEGTEAAIGIRITRVQGEDDVVVREEPETLTFVGGVKAWVYSRNEST